MSRNGPLYESGTDIEKLYHINHIPYRYWKSNSSSVAFTNTSYTPTDEAKIKLSSESQLNFYRGLLDEIKEHKSLKKYSGMFVCISSVPSEDMAMEIGVTVGTSLIQRDVSADVCMIDLSLFYPVDRSRIPNLTIIHNVTSDSTRDRIQVARDYIKWATRTSLCLLCTAGRNPFEMCYEVLRMPANMVLYSDERSTKRTLDF